MHRTPFPKISAFLSICTFLICSSLFGQTKTAGGEVVVTKCWSYSLGDAAGEQIASDGSRVFIGLDGGRVGALSLDGKKIWSSEFGGEIKSNILPIDGELFVVTSTVSNDAAKPGSSLLRSLSKETGITNWTLTLPDVAWHSIGGFNDAVIVVSANGAIQSVDLKNGKAKWKREINESFAVKPFFYKTRVIVGTGGKIFGISLATGEIEFMRKLPFGITALSAANGELAVGDERGNLSLFNSADKPVWTFKSGGEISNILSVGDNVLATSHDNFVYFLAGRNGGRVWKKRLAGRVAQIINIMDRYALVSSSEEYGGVLLDLTNGKVAGQIALGEDENLVSAPVVSNGLILALTNEAAYAFSLGGCSAKTKAVADE